MLRLRLLKLILVLTAAAAVIGLSGCVEIVPPSAFTANGQVRDVVFVSDEVGEVLILEQKISVGTNFFELTQSCAGKGVKVVDQKKPQTCVAKVKSKNFAAGVKGKLFTKFELASGPPATSLETSLVMK